jgi:hypothetical protein
VLSEPLYTIETDLTEEEIAMIDEGMAEYRANPSNWIPQQFFVTTCGDWVGPKGRTCNC